MLHFPPPGGVAFYTGTEPMTETKPIPLGQHLDNSAPLQEEIMRKLNSHAALVEENKRLRAACEAALPALLGESCESNPVVRQLRAALAKG
jgi:hypothetical protein